MKTNFPWHQIVKYFVFPEKKRVNVPNRGSPFARWRGKRSEGEIRRKGGRGVGTRRGRGRKTPERITEAPPPHGNGVTKEKRQWGSKKRILVVSKSQINSVRKASGKKKKAGGL